MPPHRRDRDTADDVKHEGGGGADGPAPPPSLDETLNSLLVALVAPDAPPNWTDVAVKVYSTLKIWISPSHLEVQYYSFLKKCAAASAASASGASGASGASSASSKNVIAGTSSARTKADHEAMAIAASLKRCLAFEDSRTGGVKREADSHRGRQQQQQQQQQHAAASATTKAEPSVKSEVKQEVKHEPHAAAGAGAVGGGGGAAVAGASAGGGVGATHSLASLWDTSLSSELLLDLFGVADRTEHREVFEWNVHPRTQVYCHGAPVGKPYNECVARPTSLDAIRQRVLQAQIRTPAQLYLELSQMIANTVMFNLPGAYYPAVARQFLASVVAAWADYVAKME